MKKCKIIKNKYGYREVETKPQPEELSKYYSELYYQQGKGSFDKESNYTESEVLFFLNKVEQKHLLACKVNETFESGGKNFLDVGAGEGWALKYFSECGWSVTGLDYSDCGCKSCNPGVLGKLITGDIYSNLENIFNNNVRFDVVLLDNVLEHVIDPFKLLINIRKILSDDGVLIVDVPNDFSASHKKLLDDAYISNEFWLAFPDHLSYFNKEGLTLLADDAGLSAKKILTAYPIDFNLFNPDSNYVENKERGRNCHLARVEIENLLHSISPEKTNVLYEALSDLGLGRDLVMFFTKKV